MSLPIAFFSLSIHLDAQEQMQGVKLTVGYIASLAPRSHLVTFLNCRSISKLDFCERGASRYQIQVASGRLSSS